MSRLQISTVYNLISRATVYWYWLLYWQLIFVSTFPVPLQSIDVDVSIQGFVANVTSDLTYINKGDDAIGAIFTFPMDEQSAVYHFEAEIDGKVIVAECQDKDQVSNVIVIN